MVECVLSELAIELPRRVFRDDLISALIAYPYWRANRMSETEAYDVAEHICLILTLQGWPFSELLSGSVLAFQACDAADLARGAVSNVFTND